LHSRTQKQKIICVENTFNTFGVLYTHFFLLLSTSPGSFALGINESGKLDFNPNPRFKLSIGALHPID